MYLLEKVFYSNSFTRWNYFHEESLTKSSILNDCINRISVINARVILRSIVHSRMQVSPRRIPRETLKAAFGLRYSLVASIRKVWWSFASAITHKWELSPPWLSHSLLLSPFLAHGLNGKGLVQPFRCRYASPLVCGIDVAYTRLTSVDKGEQWIENCFIFRFLIRSGLSFFLVGNRVYDNVAAFILLFNLKRSFLKIVIKLFDMVRF